MRGPVHDTLGGAVTSKVWLIVVYKLALEGALAKSVAVTMSILNIRTVKEVAGG